MIKINKYYSAQCNTVYSTGENGYSESLGMYQQFPYIQYIRHFSLNVSITFIYVVTVEFRYIGVFSVLGFRYFHPFSTVLYIRNQAAGGF